MAKTPASDDEKRKMFSFRLVPSLLARLREIGREDDRSGSYMVEKAIREFIERNDQQSKRK